MSCCFLDRRGFVHQVGLGAAAALLAPAHSARAQAAGTLKIGVPQSFSSLDPYKKIGRIDYNAVVNICDTLVTYGTDYLPRPLLAASWEQPDPATWRFKLQPGATCHDGTPFDGEVARYSLEKARSSNVGAQFKPIAEVAVVDPTTVEVRCSGPFPTLLAQLTQPYAAIVSPKAYDAAGDSFGRRPVGSGPFKVESFEPNRELVMARHAGYWREDGTGAALPHLERVVWQVLPDAETASLALQTGEIDFLYQVPLAFAASLGADPSLKLSETPTLGWNYAMFHTGQPPFDDRHLRRAVQLAVDRAAIVAAVSFGHAVPALGPISPGSWAYDPAVEKDGFYGATARPDQARAELAAAGKPDGFEFTLIYPAESPFDAMAQAVQAQLGAVGIKANLEGKDIGGVLDNLFASQFSALMIDWSGRIDEALALPSFFAAGGGNNFGKYRNPEVDRLLDAAGTATGVPARARLYQQAQRLIVEDSPHAWLTTPTELRAMRGNVDGFTNYGDFRMRLDTVRLTA